MEAPFDGLLTREKSPIYFEAYGESSVLQNPRAFSSIRVVPNSLVSLSTRHITETTLLKVHNDILFNMDNQKVTLLVLLDLSSAFMKYFSVVLR